MLRKTSIVHGAVVGAALALVAAGTASPALADPPSHSNASVNGQQHAGTKQGGSSSEKDKKDKPKKVKKPRKDKPAQSGKPAKTKPSTSKPAKSKPATSKPAQSKPTKAKPATPAQAGGTGDPAGNNGTVKIAPLGELDGIPDNSPHPGCTFQVEWYGFDEGADVVSTVSFAMHAPTADVGLSVDGPATVFVGGDPASGAGTDSGLDGTATYTLSFDGEPHPKQGYHVKLTVATPRSQGNDTKTKVFWVEPCAATPAAGVVAAAPDQGTVAAAGAGTAASSSSASSSDEPSVLGAQASTDQALRDSGADDADRSADVPSAVDAGEEGRSFGEWARSPLPLLVVGLGLLIAAGAVVLRRRARA